MKRATFFILCLEGAILSFNVAACAALIPSISSEFGISLVITGKLVWLYMLPYGIAALFYGPLVRFFNVRKIELFSLSLFSLANLWAGLSKTIDTLFMARFLTGVFGASVIPLALILIARNIDRQNRGRFVGIFFSSTFIASLMGLFLSGIIPWRLIFLIPGFLGLLLCIPLYFYLPNFREEASRLRINYFAALKQNTVITIFTYIFLVSLCYHGIQQWLAVYFSAKINLGQFLISMLITLTSLSGILGELLGGWFADLIGRLKTIEIGMTLMILSIFLLTFKLPLFILALIMITWGLGWTFNHAGLSTLLTDVPEEFLNEVASLNSSVRFLSGGLGVAIGGFFIHRSFNLNFLVFGWSLILLAILAKNLLIIK